MKMFCSTAGRILIISSNLKICVSELTCLCVIYTIQSKTEIDAPEKITKKLKKDDFQAKYFVIMCMVIITFQHRLKQWFSGERWAMTVMSRDRSICMKKRLK